MKYIVYQTTNLINNKIYIGVHQTEDPNKFDGYIGNGIYINKPYTYIYNKTYMQQAVCKYGVKNFKRTTLAIFDSEEEAYLLESQLVNEEFLARNDVYNMVLGGTMQDYNYTETYQYDLQGNFIKKYEMVKLAAKSVNVNSSSISCAILYKIPVKNYLWTNIYLEKLDITKFRINLKNKIKIYIYDKFGNYLNEFDSACKASKYIKCNSFEILRSARLGYCIQDKYYCSTIKCESYDKARTIYLKIRKVYQYNNDGEFIKEFETQSEAEQLYPNSNITKAIKSKSLCKNNYYWGLEKLENYNIPIKRNIARKVGRFDTDNNLLDTWNSATQCSKIWGKGIFHCLNEDYDLHKGYIFKYLD